MAIKVWRAIIRPFQDPGKAVAAYWWPVGHSIIPVDDQLLIPPLDHGSLVPSIGTKEEKD